MVRTLSRKAAYAGSPLSGHWLRGVDLNFVATLIKGQVIAK
jgi:hypothetical protein